MVVIYEVQHADDKWRFVTADQEHAALHGGEASPTASGYPGFYKTETSCS